MKNVLLRHLPRIFCVLLLAVFSCSILHAVPVATQYFNETQIARGAEFQSAKRMLWFYGTLITTGTLLILTAGKTGIRLRVALAMKAKGHPWLLTLFMSAATITILRLVRAPMLFYSSFTVNHRFGLSNQSLSGWIWDYLLAFGVSLLISVFSLSLLYFVMERCKSWWWLPAGLLAISGTALLVWCGPVFIAPLFNTYTPLKDVTLKAKILKLAEKARVPVKEVLVVNASKRTKALNAYYTGLAGTRRIVLYDTLLSKLSHREILSIVAHELGHWKAKHIQKGLAIGALGILFAAYVLFWIMREICSEKLWGLYEPADSGTVPLVLLIILLIQLLGRPVECSISRVFEREADHTALILTDDPEAFISVERKLAIRNLAEIHPPEWFVFLMHTHPPVLERIQAALSYRQMSKGQLLNLQRKNFSPGENNGRFFPR